MNDSSHPPENKFSLRAGTIGGLITLAVALVVLLIYGFKPGRFPFGEGSTAPPGVPPQTTTPQAMAPSKMMPGPIADPDSASATARVALRLVSDDLRSGRFDDATALAQSLSEGARNAILFGLVRVILARTPPDQIEGELEKVWLANYDPGSMPIYAVPPPAGTPYAPPQTPMRPRPEKAEKKPGPAADPATIRRALDVAAKIESPGPRAQALLEIEEAMGTGKPAGEEEARRWRDDALRLVRGSELMPIAPPAYVAVPSVADLEDLVDALADLDLKLRRKGESTLDRRRQVTKAAAEQYGNLLIFLQSRSEKKPEPTAASRSMDLAAEENLVLRALEKSQALYRRDQEAGEAGRTEFLKKGLDILLPAAISGAGFLLSGLLTPALAKLTKHEEPAHPATSE